MAQTWSSWTNGGAILDTDTLVGLRSGANVKFSPTQLLLAAKNLEDLASVATARENLGLATDDDVAFATVAVADTDASHVMTIKCNENLSANRILNLVLGNAARTITLSGNPTLADWFDQSVKAAASPTFASVKQGAANGLTAFAGGGQASALALTAAINRVTTVATAADSVKLPAAVAGNSVTVINAAAANAMAVFPVSGESINALSPDASLSVAANKMVIFSCAVNGTWNSCVTA